MSTLPAHCTPSSPLLHTLSAVFHTCLPTPLALASTACGYLSITSWLFAQLPQIAKNHRRRSTEGLSVGFLAIWLAGDICNFLGAVWTRQMFFQQLVGGYYVLVDVALVAQYVHYARRPTVLEGEALPDADADAAEPKAVKSLPSPRLASPRLFVTLGVLARVAGAAPISGAAPAARFLDTNVLGTYLSWLSTALYLTSRLPQLLLNLSRRSTDGLAISLFAAAFCGNLFYSASILLNPLGHADYPAWGGGGLAGADGSSRDEWWGRTLPFLIGAAGVLVLDAAVGWQWVLWGEAQRGKSAVLREEEVRAVAGGWTPWRAGIRVRDAAETERELLLAAGAESKYGTPGRA